MIKLGDDDQQVVRLACVLVQILAGAEIENNGVLGIVPLQLIERLLFWCHALAGAAKQQPPVEYNFPEKGRFVVQIGAYVEADRVANVRRRLSQAGLNNYTQKVTIDGKQVTRVRIGPFTSRKQMEQVASKVRALGLPVSLYQL